ncbi:MAG: hypothetical protein WKF96_07460 [Solirubrobacteraceae bacterium]
MPIEPDARETFAARQRLCQPHPGQKRGPQDPARIQARREATQDLARRGADPLNLLGLRKRAAGGAAKAADHVRGKLAADETVVAALYCQLRAPWKTPAVAAVSDRCMYLDFVARVIGGENVRPVPLEDVQEVSWILRGRGHIYVRVQDGTWKLMDVEPLARAQQFEEALQAVIQRRLPGVHSVARLTALLQRLDEQWKSGALSDEEFAAKKVELLRDI